MATRRYLRNRVSVAAAIVLLLIIATSVLAPVISPHDPAQQYRREGLKDGMPVGPSEKFPLGTDGYGRDMLTRLIYGGRIALLVGLTASGIAVLIGVVVGSVAGLAGGRVDMLIMRLVDIVLSLPTLFVILLFVSLSKPSLSLTIIVIALLSWAAPTRVFRAEVSSLREREFVTAARSLGAPMTSIFTRHILPHILPLIIIYISLGVAPAMFAEASLSFLGLGVPPPTPTWGNMVQVGINFYRAAPLQVIAPGLAIVITVVCFNLIGSGLRDALDPTVSSKR
ncbi:MAG: peptide ABC transporter permease [Candidatus Roseilinea sp.]|nr:MAG: peptide ABC transporter permease [Candidatus Roseilinea sp.]